MNAMYCMYNMYKARFTLSSRFPQNVGLRELRETPHEYV